MQPDDHICYCYHVSYRKLANFAKREPLQRPSQMSECLGAGTGCGWCIPILKRIFEAAQSDTTDADVERMQPDEYAARRGEYIEEGQDKHHF